MFPSQLFRLPNFYSLLIVGATACILCSSGAIASETDNKHLLIYGDSLSAAYGMEIEQGWVSLLSKDLSKTYKISNASISGETSAGGLARLATTLNELNPDIVFLELGANDGLSGISIEKIKDNLEMMIAQIEQSGAIALLAAISLPANYGPRYTDSFRHMFTDIAQRYKIALIDLHKPEFLGDPKYIQADGLHPTVLSQALIRDAVLEFIQEQDFSKKD